MWCVYILECSDGTLYTGITNHPERRVREHNQGKAARYTRGRGPVRLAYTETASSRSTAAQRERTIRHLTLAAKQRLIQSAASPSSDVRRPTSDV